MRDTVVHRTRTCVASPVGDRGLSAIWNRLNFVVIFVSGAHRQCHHVLKLSVDVDRIVVPLERLACQGAILRIQAIVIRVWSTYMPLERATNFVRRSVPPIPRVAKRKAQSPG
jgi:hypothetical protein